MAPPLAERRRVIAVDLPGHGGSSPLPPASNLEAFADRLHLMLEQERAMPAAVVGHSFGGGLSAVLAARQPRAVSALVLVAASGVREEVRLERTMIAAAGFVRPGRLAAPWQDAIVRYERLRRAVFGGWGAFDAAALSAEAVQGLLGPQLLHTDTRSAGRALIAGPPPELDRIRCPTLVLWGARDRLCPLDDGYAYARRLGAPLRAVAGAGHLVIVERPDALLDAIESFLGSLER
jgi:pyruvate dehydrogenase E2 component (dihydrolipoamide acetyltransferase)